MIITLIVAFTIRKNFQTSFDLTLLAEENAKTISTLFHSQPDSILLISKVEGGNELSVSFELGKDDG